jgi:anti-sigma regulatory factor (Ser/Thr protein kinase)
MTAGTPGIHRSFDAEPESVGAARRAIAEYAADMGMTGSRLDDLRTTVGEASTNVVRHAYPDGGGRFEVEGGVEDGLLTVIVRDSGVGLRPELIGPAPCTHLGLGLISALADRYAIRGRPTGGTEVRISLAV